MPNKLKTLLLGGLMAMSLAFSAGSMAGDALQRVIDFNTLKVGMSASQPPMNMVSREGKLMGFDVDLAKAMATAMQVRLEIKAMPFGDLMSALENDEVDMVISGMAITPQRSEMASFIGPYMMSGKSILTKNSVLSKVNQAEQFNRSELKLAALRGSTSASFITKVAPEAQLILVEDYDEAVAMVINDKIDGLVADMPICILSVLRHPDAGLTTLEKPLTVEPLGIAVSKDDQQFLNLVQNYLDAYGKVGVLSKLRQKWLEDKGWIAALP
jgi:polar amino acid transport system substrate-binding protein